MIGFELESFIRNAKGEFVLVPDDLPKDECGYLVEFRGKPSDTAFEAAGLLQAEIKNVTRRFGEFLLSDSPIERLPKKLTNIAMRTFGKPRVPWERGSLYGLQYKDNDSFARAGLHIHFTGVENNFSCPKCNEKYSNGYLAVENMVGIIQKLDTKFRQEIYKAKRLPGLFETGKFHGGFEYRSLPANIDFWQVAEFIDSEVSIL